MNTKDSLSQREARKRKIAPNSGATFLGNFCYESASSFDAICFSARFLNDVLLHAICKICIFRAQNVPYIV